MSYHAMVMRAAALSALLLTAACGERAEPEPPKAVIPTSSRYEGKIVFQPAAGRGRQDGLFLVKTGKRHWISDGNWLAQNGYDGSSVMAISAVDFNAIREGAPL